ncbi:MAG: stage 0 sporulation protein [Nitrospirae bacterium]|nr:stage 0 sporulation protein [Nitrospirota bacterium]
MVVGVRFKSCDRIYPFDADGINVSPGVLVVTESDMGLKIGSVVRVGCKMEEPQQLKPILRTATEEDIEADKNNRFFEEEAKTFCIEKAKSHNLHMKLITTEATLDRKRLIFYFTADGRIDFRGLVRDLAGKFKTRIEMRQIGVRDEVKFIGGIGACGRQTCCTLFLTTFEPVSIRMAKKQELTLNPGKLSGICGRLMCCLGFEYERSLDTRSEAAEEITLEEPQEETMLIVGMEEDVVNPVKCLLSNGVKPSENLEERIQTTEHMTQTTGEKTLDEKVQIAAVETTGLVTTQSEIQSKTERKEKGEPFSRRKGFWKKKKRRS